MHRGCLPNGGARGEDFARNEIPHPCCVLYLSAKVWFLFEIAIDSDMVDADEQQRKVRNIIRWQRIGCIVVKISETLNVSLKEALDLFYRSETCRRFHDEETGLYLQGNLYVLNDFLAEISKPVA